VLVLARLDSMSSIMNLDVNKRHPKLIALQDSNGTIINAHAHKIIIRSTMELDALRFMLHVKETKLKALVIIVYAQLVRLLLATIHIVIKVLFNHLFNKLVHSQIWLEMEQETANAQQDK